MDKMNWTDWAVLLGIAAVILGVGLVIMSAGMRFP